jgi:hypothetical protein
LLEEAGVPDQADGVANQLGLGPIGDEESVGGIDDDDVVQAEQSDQSLGVPPNRAVGGADLDEFSADAVSVEVAVNQVSQSVPVSHVRPAHLRRDDRDAFGFGAAAVNDGRDPTCAWF